MAKRIAIADALEHDLPLSADDAAEHAMWAALDALVAADATDGSRLVGAASEMGDSRLRSTLVPRSSRAGRLLCEADRGECACSGRGVHLHVQPDASISQLSEDARGDPVGLACSEHTPLVDLPQFLP